MERIGHAPQQQNKFGSGPGPHGVKVEYENVVLSVTGGRVTVLVNKSDGSEKIVVINQRTGEVE